VPLLLARVDDRLVHGQVAHGWGAALRPTLFLVVSDALGADPSLAELFLLAVPEGARGRCVSMREALDPETRALIDRERTVLLLPGTAEAVALREAGFPLDQLNLGGLHHAPGKVAVLPYIYLDDSDRAHLRRLAALGVRVSAQDLPANPVHDLESLLEKAGS
jgi:mannose/fructose/N-acetylgalactosamine-specific phosphotransferase system component IIB